MLTIKYVPPSLPLAADLPDLPENSDLPRQYSRLRLYMVGSKEDTGHGVNYLHKGGRIDRINWSHTIVVPENGIIIQRDPGDVLRYLQRDRLFQ
jgi:hypothetical protein